MATRPTLQPGDCLLYSRLGSLFGAIIAIKTWSKYTHVEIMCQVDTTVASRDGLGVGMYHIREDGLARILRPNARVNMQDALYWFYTQANGQRYDWLGLLNFYTAQHRGRDNHRQFCSEFATRFYRQGGFDPFAADLDADCVPPSYFAVSPEFTTIWEKS
jgi:hypothetical protein